jgi:hypothetical protein
MSTDGTSWKQVLAVSGLPERTFLAVLGDALYLFYPGGGISNPFVYKTTNGTTWTRVVSGMTPWSARHIPRGRVLTVPLASGKYLVGTTVFDTVNNIWTPFSTLVFDGGYMVQTIGSKVLLYALVETQQGSTVISSMSIFSVALDGSYTTFQSNLSVNCNSEAQVDFNNNIALIHFDGYTCFSFDGATITAFPNFKNRLEISSNTYVTGAMQVSDGWLIFVVSATSSSDVCAVMKASSLSLNADDYTIVYKVTSQRTSEIEPEAITLGNLVPMRDENGIIVFFHSYSLDNGTTWHEGQATINGTQYNRSFCGYPVPVSSVNILGKQPMNGDGYILLGTTGGTVNKVIGHTLYLR